MGKSAHLISTTAARAAQQRNASKPRSSPRYSDSYKPTKAEEAALERRINDIVSKHTVLCGEPENWADAGKSEKLKEQLYRNELLRIQALKDSGALVPLAEVAKRDELTAGAFMWALGEMLEWASEKIPAHLRNDARIAGGEKLAEILSEVSRRVASGMEEVKQEEDEQEDEVLPVQDEGERE